MLTLELTLEQITKFDKINCFIWCKKIEITIEKQITWDYILFKEFNGFSLVQVFSPSS